MWCNRRWVSRLNSECVCILCMICSCCWCCYCFALAQFNRFSNWCTSTCFLLLSISFCLLCLMRTHHCCSCSMFMLSVSIFRCFTRVLIKPRIRRLHDIIALGISSQRTWIKTVFRLYDTIENWCVIVSPKTKVVCMNLSLPPIKSAVAAF